MLTVEVVGPRGIHVGRALGCTAGWAESPEGRWEGVERDAAVPSTAEAEGAGEGGLDIAIEAAVYLKVAPIQDMLILST